VCICVQLSLVKWLLYVEYVELFSLMNGISHWLCDAMGQPCHLPKLKTYLASSLLHGLGATVYL